MSSSSNRQKHCLLFVSMLLIVFGAGLSIYSLFSAAWQRVHLRELQVEHQHGILVDCVRVDNLVPIFDTIRTHHQLSDTRLHCVYKFDSSAQKLIRQSIDALDTRQDAVATEAEHHLFAG